MRVFALVIGLLLISVAAHAETDVFMRAVGFALTGSDDADAIAIDRTDCVFGYKNDVFHLNNVQTDRVQIRGWEMKGVDYRWVNVDLHGDDVVVEHAVVPISPETAKVLGPEYRHTHPGAFASSEGHKEYQLRLSTGDVDRVKRAWEYIYSHGCVGKKSPF